MRKIGLLLGIVLLLAISGCHEFFVKSERIVVAECYNNKLYEEDLVGVVPTNADPMDSLTRVNAFRQQLLLHQAEINLSKEQLDFSKQLQDYRNSLVIYAYESQLIEQRLDTVVGEDEIAAYYENNKENFQLRSTMVKVAYVILKEDCKYQKEFQQLMSNRDTLMLGQLDVLATHHALTSFLDVDSWVRLDDLLREVPIEIYNTESFLKKNRFVRFEKDDFVYMVRFEDYLMKESVSPIEIESDNIKNVILQKRKKELISKMNVDLYEKASKEKVFVVY